MSALAPFEAVGVETARPSRRENRQTGLTITAAHWSEMARVRYGAPNAGKGNRGPRRRSVEAPAARWLRRARRRVRGARRQTRWATRRRARCTSIARPGCSDGSATGVAVDLRDPGLHRAARRVAVAADLRAERDRAARCDVHRRPGTLPRRDRRLCRRLDLARRFAVPQLHRRPGATSTTSATRSSRSSTAATRPRRTAAAGGSPESPPGATGRWSCRCCAPTAFGALASHAGDALFEVCYLPEFPVAVRSLRDHFDGSFEGFLAGAQNGRPLRLPPLRTLPEPLCDGGRILAGRRARPAGSSCRSSSRPGDCAWMSGKRGSSATRCGWRPATPTRCGRCGGSTSTPAAPTSTSSTSGRRRSPPSSTKLGVEHSLELFDGAHGGIGYRYPGAIRELVRALEWYDHPGP